MHSTLSVTTKMQWVPRHTSTPHGSVNPFGATAGWWGCPSRDGAGARTWLAFTCDRTVEIPAGAIAGTTAVDGPIHPDFDAIFRTCNPSTVYPEQNRMVPHCWGMAPLTLAAGSTVLALKGHLKSLEEGSVVALEAAVARHPVRISRPPLLF